MDESLARGHARSALRTAETRSIAQAVVRVAGDTVPFNEKGQRRWSRRIIAASKPALIGKPIARFGKTFELALPIFETRFDTLFEAGWRGLALGQVGFTPGPLQETAYEEMVLILDCHALTRIGQRADVVVLDEVLALLTPSLPWCVAHEVAAGVAQVDRVWLPVEGGILVCRLETHKEEPDRRLLFAATFLSEARLSPYKTRVLALMRQGQDGLTPRFPLLGGFREHIDECVDLAERLLPAYLQLPPSEEEDVA